MKKLLFLLPVIIFACGSESESIPDTGVWTPCDCDKPPSKDLIKPGARDESSVGVDQSDKKNPDSPNPPSTDSDAGSTPDQDDSGSEGGQTGQDAGDQTSIDSGSSSDSGSTDDKDKDDKGKDDKGKDDKGKPEEKNECSSSDPRTCEEQLHCCTNECKLLIDRKDSSHVQCVQSCSDSHSVCVKDRRPSACYKKNKH